MKSTKVEKIKPLTLNVTGCLRCGGSHTLKFKPFKRPTPTEFKRWAMCPVTKEPLMQAMVSKNDPRLAQCHGAGCRLAEVPQAYIATIKVDQKPGKSTGTMTVEVTRKQS